MAAAAQSSTSGRFTPPPLTLTPPSLEVVQAVARCFAIAVDAIAPQILQEQCFQHAYQLMEQGQWDVINEQRELLVHFVNGIGQTLIMQAIARDNYPLVEAMAEHDFAEVVDAEGNTPVHYLSRFLDTDYPKYFEKLCLDVEHGVETRNMGGQTPLHQAAAWGNLGAIDHLIEEGASINSEAAYAEPSSTTWLTPLGFAVVHGHLACVEKLLQHPNVHIPVRSDLYPTLLHLAIYANQYEILQYLLSAHAEKFTESWKIENSQYMPPLLFAAYLGDREALEVLKVGGADIHAVNSKEQTLAHMAVMGGHAGLVEQLYQWDVNLSSSDKSGKIPTQYANKENRAQLRAARAVTRFSKKARVEARGSAVVSMRRPPENLVFRGGGPAGIAYAGVFTALHEQKLEKGITRAAGASAGAIAATFVALGYLRQDAAAIRALLDVDISAWLDVTDLGRALIERIGQGNLQGALNDLGGTARALVRSTAVRGLSHAALPMAKDVVLFNFKGVAARYAKGAHQAVSEIPDGLCSGDAFRQWIEKQIEEVTGISNCTFKEFRDYRTRYPHKGLKHLHIFATRVDDKMQIVRLTTEDITGGKAAFYDDVVISSGVRASMSIPFVFEPHVLLAKVKQPDGSIKVVARPDLGVYVDGGVMMNFPLEAFDEMRYQGSSASFPSDDRRTNRRTLGFTFTRSKGEVPPPRNAVDIAKGLLSIYSDAEEVIRAERGDVGFRAIALDRKAVTMMRFDVTEDEKDAVIADARRVTCQALEDMHIIRPQESIAAAGAAAAGAQGALPEIAFGAAKWAQYFGDVGAEPPIPAGILASLKAACPFWPGKRIEETHLLTLIPATVDDKPFCLDLLGDLIQHPKTGHATKYAYCWDKLKAQLGQQSPGKSYWVLMSRDVVGGTRGKNYKDQCAVLNSKRQGLPYEPPGVLEAATAILMEHVQSGAYLFGREPWTFTRCREQIAGYQGAVGGFGAAGLRILIRNRFFDYYGLAAARKF